MKWWSYTKEFAAAVARAKLSDRKKFKFKGDDYFVADHIKGVLSDVREKRYRLKMV